MQRFHELEGFLIVGGWAVLAGWGGVLLGIKREAGRGYWALCGALQVLLAVQLVAGVVLFAAGERRPVLHYFYGAVFPAVFLVIAHVLTRGTVKPPYHIWFTGAAVVCLALAARALQTGLAGG